MPLKVAQCLKDIVQAGVCSVKLQFSRGSMCYGDSQCRLMDMDPVNVFFSSQYSHPNQEDFNNLHINWVSKEVRTILICNKSK